MATRLLFSWDVLTILSADVYNEQLAGTTTPKCVIPILALWSVCWWTPYSLPLNFCSLAWREWKPRESWSNSSVVSMGRKAGMEKLGTFSEPHPSPPLSHRIERTDTWGPLRNTRETTKHVEACTPARQLKQGKWTHIHLKWQKKEKKVILAGGVNQRAHSPRGGLAQIFFFYVSISDWKNMSMCLHMGLFMT